MSHLSHYRMIKRLGAGSFAKVERKSHIVAEHYITKQKVAIKIIKKKQVKDQNLLRKVKREIKILKIFRHPHIIRL